MKMTKPQRCLANIEAVFSEYGIPPLIAIRVEQDRGRFLPTKAWRAWWAKERRNGKNFPGGRENRARCAMEITHDEKADLVEVDFDYWNPLFGAGLAFMHALECLWNKLGHKTDPFKIAKGRGLA